MDKKNLLILCGPSGSGKTTLRNKLIEDKSKISDLEFFRCIQLTSRDPRLDETYTKYPKDGSYIFIEDDVLDEISSLLIGVNDDRENYGGKYGTLPLFLPGENLLNIIILNSNGINDFLSKKELCESFNKIIIAYLELNENIRDSRNTEQEKSDLLSIIKKYETKINNNFFNIETIKCIGDGNVTPEYLIPRIKNIL
jgi:GTPase SAR1 family protein